MPPIYTECRKKLRISAAVLAQADAVTREVDCDKGQSLEAAVMKGQGSAEHFYIDVRGHCEEVVTIERDDVTIDGDGEATVGGFYVQGGRRITLAALTVTGPGTGIEVARGDVKVVDVTLADNAEFGLFLGHGSSAVLESSTISGNSIGLTVRNGSNVIINESDISNNYETGIETWNAASVVVDDYSTISGNEGGGIDAALHTSIVLMPGSSITSNSNYGVKLAEDCGLDIRPDVVICGNGYLSEFCEGAEFCGVYCGDTESSVLVLSDIDDVIVCTDFNE